MSDKKKKTLTPAKVVRKQYNKNNRKKKKKKTHNLNHDTNTNANCLASLDKWDPPNKWIPPLVKNSQKMA